MSKVVLTRISLTSGGTEEVHDASLGDVRRYCGRDSWTGLRSTLAYIVVALAYDRFLIGTRENRCDQGEARDGHEDKIFHNKL